MMTEKLKVEIVKLVSVLHQKIGQTVEIEDWICTNGRTYDRHQTRYGKYRIEIEEFYVRTSGSIATILNKNQQIEFRTDSVKYIEIQPDRLTIEIQMKDDVWRKLTLKNENPVDNIR